MKTNFASLLPLGVRCAAATLLVAGLGAGVWQAVNPIQAIAGPPAVHGAALGHLEGSWLVFETIDPPYFDPFPALFSFLPGGVMIVSYSMPAPGGAVNYGTSHGVWVRTAPGQYALTWRGFVTETATGNILETFKSRATITVDKSGNEFSGIAPGTGFNFVLTGERIQSEPLP